MPDAVPPEGFVLCMLSQIMDERQLNTAQVARLANISRPTVRKLRDNQIERVSMATVSKLCSGLRVGVGVLFRHVPRHEAIGVTSTGPTLMGADDS